MEERIKLYLSGKYSDIKLLSAFFVYDQIVDSLIPSINNNTDWIVLSRNTLSKKTYELLNLVSNTHYTVKMKSRNKFGFSGQSEPVTFTTKGNLFLHYYSYLV